MRRRDFIAGAVGHRSRGRLLRAQKLPVIGFLNTGSDADIEHLARSLAAVWQDVPAARAGTASTPKSILVPDPDAGGRGEPTVPAVRSESNNGARVAAAPALA